MMTVLQQRSTGRKQFVFCRCECGVEKEVRRDWLTRKDGAAKSCGCRQGPITHGHTRGRTNTKLYNVFKGMHARCTNAALPAYRYYGARGIKVCERWSGPDGFANFIADMGEPPADTSIDRIDTNGNYCPENCRWATDLEQSNNRRCVTFLTHDGRTQNIATWAKEWGIPSGTLHHWVKRHGEAEAIRRVFGRRDGTYIPSLDPIWLPQRRLSPPRR